MTHERMINSDKNEYLRKIIQAQIFIFDVLLGMLNDFKIDCNIFLFIFNLVEKFRDSLKPVTSVGMTFIRPIFVVIGGKVERFCLIWAIYARFAKK